MISRHTFADRNAAAGSDLLTLSDYELEDSQRHDCSCHPV
jgi:hypothetical protein